MDEPTSALDGPTERKIMDALRERVHSRSCTCVMVAHRMSTLRQCDKIVFMADGGGSVAGGEAGEAGGAFAKEEGTHEELMAMVRWSPSSRRWLHAILLPCVSVKRCGGW